MYPSTGSARIILGVAYRGHAYQGWQSQRGGRTVQDTLQAALAAFIGKPVSVVCAGRTDAGVHALQQVVHLDSPVQRDNASWVRGTNRFLPSDVAVQWALPGGAAFHARNSAKGRRYRFIVLDSPVRPAIETGLCGWSFRPLDGDAMRRAAECLIGTHDFSAFRSSHCQSRTPVKTLRSIEISRRGAYWRIDVDGNAFLHHMVRNLVGCFVMIGSGRERFSWMAEVLASRSRDAAAPTFPAEGLYFVGPYYDSALEIPDAPTAADWLP